MTNAGEAHQHAEERNRLIRRLKSGSRTCAQVVSPIATRFRLVVEGNMRSTPATISGFTFCLRSAGRSSIGRQVEQ